MKCANQFHWSNRFSEAQVLQAVRGSLCGNFIRTWLTSSMSWLHLERRRFTHTHVKRTCTHTLLVKKQNKRKNRKAVLLKRNLLSFHLLNAIMHIQLSIFVQTYRFVQGKIYKDESHRITGVWWRTRGGNMPAVRNTDKSIYFVHFYPFSLKTSHFAVI